jgi:diguanylate cyclase (GGDEF)-like protein
MMSRRKKCMVWAVWLLIVPAGHWYAYLLSPPPSMQVWEFLAPVAVAVMIACIPLIINHTVVFMTQWISIAVFLSYGLFYEMILLQAAVIVSMIARPGEKEKFYLYLLYSCMFSCISLISGLGFFAAGGQVGNTSLHNSVIPVLVYILLTFLSALCLRSLLLSFTGKARRFSGKGLIWDGWVRLVVYSLGIGQFYLNQMMGPVSFVLLGIPVFSSLVVLKMYQSSLRINTHLQKAAETGHQLTERLNVDEVLNLFIQKMTEMSGVEWAYILGFKGDMLAVVRHFERDGGDVKQIPPIQRDKGISGIVLRKGKGVIYRQKSEWKQYSRGYFPEEAESVMCVPIMRGKQVEGVLFLASSRKNAFRKFQLMIVDILCSYLAVALSNARHYEETKRESEYCALTKIPNFRYFDKYINERFGDLQGQKIRFLSLIMADIDYFKKINDQYGHQAGDQILIKVAERLQNLVQKRGIVARYGGEEFVVLLPDADAEEAYQFAETIRKTIANHPFLVHNELDPSKSIVEVAITASIGVATAPRHAMDPVSLVKYADRALYIGAKRAGRNRVADYMEDEKVR